MNRRTGGHLQHPGSAGAAEAASPREADACFPVFAALGVEGKFFFSINRYLFVAGKLTA
jgi:hypothetical protein